MENDEGLPIGELTEGGCCSCGTSPMDEEYYKSCCGIKRRLVCGGKMYFPARRTHDSHQKFAHILTPLVILALGLCGGSFWFMSHGHTYLHLNLRMLTYTIICSGILFVITIAMSALCMLSWWKSTTCIHHRFMGDFTDTEDNYIVGSKLAEDLENGHRGLAFFTTVPPSVSFDRFSSGENPKLSMLDIDYEQDHVETFRGSVDASNRKMAILQQTSQEIQDRNSELYDHVQKLDKAKSIAWMAENAPFFSCCGMDTLDED